VGGGDTPKEKMGAPTPETFYSRGVVAPHISQTKQDNVYFKKQI